MYFMMKGHGSSVSSFVLQNLHRKNPTTPPCNLFFDPSSWTSRLLFFPSMDDDVIVNVDPNELLASFEFPMPKEQQRKNDNVEVSSLLLLLLRKSHESLRNYLQLWAKQLEVQPDKGLTTPITATDFKCLVVASNTNGNGNGNGTTSSVAYQFYSDSDEQSPIQAPAIVAEASKNVASTGGFAQSPEPRNIAEGELSHSSASIILPPNVSMTLKFRPPKRYLSYKEQKGMEKGNLPDRKGAKVDAWSPGGVQLTVLVVPTSIELDSFDWKLVLEVRRCDIDDDTIIKYSSERAIVRRLTQAVRIWQKVRAMD